MNRFGRTLLAMVFAWCLAISFAVAQQAGQQDGQQTADQDEADVGAAEQEIDLDTAPVEEAATEADDQPVAGNNTGQSERFIPSEQISQDLGVSYPVDI